jgi:cysteine desulfurase
VRFHTDATQRAGKMPVDVRGLPCDMLSFAAHKFHGPKGIGALYVRRGLRIQPQVVGGPQERTRRAGTENVPAIIGFGVAARLSREWLATEPCERLAGLRDGFERGVIERLGEVVVNGGGAPRSWDISNLAFARVEAEGILLMLSERGLCASAGAACASGSIEPSPVLRAMGVPPELADGSVRFSLCRGTTPQEVAAAVEMVVETVSRLRVALAQVP